ncbi:MAG: hypothetical protein EXS35_15480 [Pedosphaera sp.]|nr:hypothetical protein [Pedosphaera sp.]
MFARDGGQSLFQRAGVHVADVGDLDVGHAEVAGDVIHAAVVATHDADADIFRGTFLRTQKVEAAERSEAGGDRSLFEKMTAGEDWFHAGLKDQWLNRGEENFARRGSDGCD